MIQPKLLCLSQSLTRAIRAMESQLPKRSLRDTDDWDLKAILQSDPLPEPGLMEISHPEQNENIIIPPTTSERRKRTAKPTSEFL